MANGATSAVELVRGFSDLSPTKREKLADEVSEAQRREKAERNLRLKNKAKSVGLAVVKPLPNTLLSTGGGLAAEFVRREGIGRYTDKINGQIAGLVAAGVVVQIVGNLPKSGPWMLPGKALAQIGAAHCALAGAMIYAAAKDKKDSPDPMKIALEGTSYKALHPDKEKK